MVGGVVSPSSSPLHTHHLHMGVDVLLLVLKHVGAEKGALLADSLEAVLALLHLQPRSCAALLCTAPYSACFALVVIPLAIRYHSATTPLPLLPLCCHPSLGSVLAR